MVGMTVGFVGWYVGMDVGVVGFKVDGRRVGQRVGSADGFDGIEVGNTLGTSVSVS